VPIVIEKIFKGCLTLASFGDVISDQMVLITELLGYKLTNELIAIQKKTDSAKSAVHLTKKQLNMLKILASGKTSIATGMTMGISLGTIRYHKSNIFKKLNVESSTQTIIKALKLGLLSLEDIDC
jgi:DNA-binding CsgD family transcriptional regulator